MSAIPALHPARTRIRLSDVDDAPLLLAYCMQNREHLAPREPSRDASYYTLEDCHRAIAQANEVAVRSRGYSLLVFAAADAPVIATLSLNNVARGAFQACHLGYGMAAHWQGHGLMHEVLEAAIAWAFDVLHLYRAMANSMPRNERSARLLSRLGFEREGYARDYLEIAGRWEDYVLTAKIRTTLERMGAATPISKTTWRPSGRHVDHASPLVRTQALAAGRWLDRRRWLLPAA